MKVVGTMFFQNNMLLIDKPRKRPTYQIVVPYCLKNKLIK